MLMSLLFGSKMERSGARHGSHEVSECESNQYENLNVKYLVESHGSQPEVVVVSVDAHVLIAPDMELGNNDDNVKLKILNN
ncbi:hypothetical protein Fmac_011595 [Flemingia macrophylla]|uniref:Uncharacterized protein n=1 Tax=Flemingia macrophylla TaxID=520843 RepID=A0ABD1MMX2_9FABA